MKNQDRFRGCLIGGAAGDALGYTVEFMQEEAIFSRFGTRGIREYELIDGEAQFSDDTQMTLFTAEGLMDKDAPGTAEGIRKGYLNWLKTQSERFVPDKAPDSGLLSVAELYSRRAPGTTCLSALHGGGRGTIAAPVNQSKGCGGVMRVAPVGLYACDRLSAEETSKLAAEAAAITHGHILGWMPAAVMAQIVQEVCQDDAGVKEAVRNALETMRNVWPKTPERTFFADLIGQALDLAEKGGNDLDAIHLLGQGWVGEEALAIAVYCAVKYADDPEKALIAAVNHRGDSDSTGALAGSILGAKLGLQGIPEKFTEKLELRDVILQTADALWAFGTEEKA